MKYILLISLIFLVSCGETIEITKQRGQNISPITDLTGGRWMSTDTYGRVISDALYEGDSGYETYY